MISGSLSIRTMRGTGTPLSSRADLTRYSRSIACALAAVVPRGFLRSTSSRPSTVRNHVGLDCPPLTGSSETGPPRKDSSRAGSKSGWMPMRGILLEGHCPLPDSATLHLGRHGRSGPFEITVRQWDINRRSQSVNPFCAHGPLSHCHSAPMTRATSDINHLDTCTYTEFINAD